MYKSSKRARLDLNDNEFGSAQSILNDVGLIKQLVLFNKQPSSSNGEEYSQSPATPKSVQPPDIEIIEQEEEINNVITSPFLDNNANNNTDPILVSQQETITNEQVAYINQEWRQHFDGIVRSHVYASEIIDLVKSASKDLDLALASLNSYFDHNSNRVDFADMEYRTPLMHSSHVEITQLLIDRGANVNLRDANGRTAIMYAPNAQIARVLIANRADLNFRDANGQTALMHAINRPHPQLKSTTNSEHYLNTYTRNFSATSSNQNNQEWLMSVYDRMELIRLLVRSVTTHNINLFDKSYSNALLLAVKANDIDTVRMLVPYGADINSGDELGRTPLMHAVLLNNLDIVRFLIDNNANVNDIDYANKSALLHALESCPKVCSDSYTLNPTSRLQRALNKSILDEIIEKSSIETINYKDPNDQKPPLIHAVLLDDIATVQALIRRGAFVNQTDQWRNTPLIYAIIRKQTKIVQVLLENNADVNVVGFGEKTPMMHVYSLEKTQSNKPPTFDQHLQQQEQQQQQEQIELVQQRTNRGRGRGRGRPRLITLAQTIPQPIPQYSEIFRQPSQNQDTKTIIYELAETILRHCSRQAATIGVCTLLNLELTREESKTVVDYAIETGDMRNMQKLMNYSIGSVYDYFYSSTPDMIRAQVNKYIEIVRPRQTCQSIAVDNSSLMLFPLQYGHFQLFEKLFEKLNLSQFIDSNLEDDAQFHNFCLEYYYLIYFISVDFQEKLLSDVMIRLSEDLIEMDKFTTLEAKRNLLITDEIVIEEESNEINAFANDLKTKREIVEGIFNRITCFTPVILKMANWLIKPTKPFESSLSDEYSLECEKFLKTRPFSKNLF